MKVPQKGPNPATEKERMEALKADVLKVEVSKVKASQAGMSQAEVISKLPGFDPSRYKTKTILVIDHTRNLDFILYKMADGKLSICGIVESKIMDEVSKIAIKVFRRHTRETGRTVSFLTEYCDTPWSFLAQVLETSGQSMLYPDMDAHHCNGNRYDHRVANGAFLPISTHQAFHRGAAKAAAQGYGAFFAFVKSLDDPNLLAHYVNSEHRVLFRCETDEQMRQDVILEFFGSVERFDRFCKAVQEKIEGQTEKEIRFDLTF